MTVLQKNKRIYIWLFVISLLLNIGPLIFYATDAYMSAVDKPVGQYILTGTLTVGVILCIAAVVLKHIPKCTVWLILIGLYICLDGILSVIIVLAATQLVDELIIAPLCHKYKTRIEASKVYEEYERAK